MSILQRLRDIYASPFGEILRVVDIENSNRALDNGFSVDIAGQFTIRAENIQWKIADSNLQIQLLGLMERAYLDFAENSVTIILKYQAINLR